MQNIFIWRATQNVILIINIFATNILNLSYSKFENFITPVRAKYLRLFNRKRCGDKIWYSHSKCLWIKSYEKKFHITFYKYNNLTNTILATFVIHLVNVALITYILTQF